MLPNLSCFNGKYESESNINKKVFFLKKNGDLAPANKLMNYLVQFGFSFYFFSFAVFFFVFLFSSCVFNSNCKEIYRCKL